MLTIAVDCDNMLFEFPGFFKEFFPAMQQKGNHVGILTGRSSDELDQLKDIFAKMGIEPNFIITKPDDLKDLPNGVFKAKVCNELEADILFDDFQCNDQEMLGDFFSLNTRTVPFTSWAYQEE